VAAAQKMQINSALLISADGAVQLTASMQKRLEFTDKALVTRVVP
jgi:FAD:protein FMN transferase